MKQRESGQTLVLVAVAIVALVAVLLLVLNAGALILDQRALARAVEDAAIAALAPERAGEAPVDALRAGQVAREVLTMELRNLKRLQESPAAAAAAAQVEVFNPASPGECVDIGDGRCHQGPVVRVTADVHLCPPAWSCVAVRMVKLASLKTTVPALSGATPVPGMSIPITLP